ncbi:hypothetical protein Tco_0878672 [Tanacetum coccineum]|uniref:Uncharacterized protein n=1 Tax=Tanacetum coccineum TaxID=301880 RepID=A0ABQ5C1Z4_9ASTR
MIASVEKTAQNADFYQIIDFLTGCSINYSLLVDPDLIGLWLQQFWATASLKVINDVPHIPRSRDTFQMRKHSTKFSCRITPLTPSMLEVVTALAAEEEHSTSPHSRAASSARDAQHSNSKCGSYSTFFSVQGKFRDSRGKPFLKRNKIIKLKAKAQRTVHIRPPQWNKDEGTFVLRAQWFKKKIQHIRFLDDISGEIEELDLETTQSTARQGGGYYYSKDPNLKMKQSFKPLTSVQFQVKESEEQTLTKLLKYLGCDFQTNRLSIPGPVQTPTSTANSRHGSEMRLRQPLLDTSGHLVDTEDGDNA